MPELGEVAHATALLRKYLLGRTVQSVTAQPDELLYVKPLTNEKFQAALTDREVTGVGRNGKYFMVEVARRQTLVLHFGMTGWLRVKDVDTIIMMESGGDRKQKRRLDELAAQKDAEDSQTNEKDTQANAKDKALWPAGEWPPRFTKFMLTAGESEIAFSDPRRLGRVRLLDVPLDQVGVLEPLVRLGTDFSQTELPVAEMVAAITKRRVPVKSLLLDQAIFSGVGNWMADEILHQARLHPEQYAHTLPAARAAVLYEKVLEVCRMAAETEGNSALFPPHWLMLHRWGKARSKKEVQRTPAGHAVAFVSVGGRTSCYVPELQKKLGRGEADEDVKEEEEDERAEAGDLQDIKKEELEVKYDEVKEEAEEPKVNPKRRRK